METAAFQVSRQQLFTIQTQSCDAAVGVACGPDLARVDQAGRRAAGAADALSTWVDDEAMLAAGSPMSPAIRESRVSRRSKEGTGENHDIPRRGHAVSSCWGSLPGRGRRQSAGTSCDPTRRGRSGLLSRVPDGRHQGPEHGWLACRPTQVWHRRISTKVIVVCATGVGLAAPASSSKLTTISGPAAASRRPTITERIHDEFVALLPSTAGSSGQRTMVVSADARSAGCDPAYRAGDRLHGAARFRLMLLPVASGEEPL